MQSEPGVRRPLSELNGTQAPKSSAKVGKSALGCRTSATATSSVPIAASTSVAAVKSAENDTISSAKYVGRSCASSQFKTSGLPIAKSRVRRENGRENGRETIAAKASVAARLGSVSAAGPPPGTLTRRKTAGFNFTSRPVQQTSRLSRFNDEATQMTYRKVLEAEEKAELFRKQAEETAARLENISALSSGSDSLRADVNEMKRILQEVSAASELSKAKFEEGTESSTKFTEIRAMLEQKLDESNGRFRDMQQRVYALEMQVIDRDAALQRAQMEQKTVEDERDFLLESVSSEKKSVMKLKASLDQVHDEIDNLKCKAQRDLDQLRQENEKAERNIEFVASGKIQAEISQRETANKLESAKADIEQYRTKVSSQEVVVSSLRSQIAAVEVRIAAMEQDCLSKDKKISKLESTIDESLTIIAKLEEQAHADESERRKLHNALQELKGNIRVFCRVRPLVGSEIDQVSEETFQYTERGRGLRIEKSVHSDQPVDSGMRTASQRYSKSFMFDRVFGPTSSQEDVFSEISQLIQSALDGYRVCIFAYGQTGSGKTHTIMGTESDLGMIPRSVQQIFNQADRLAKDQWKFAFRASFLEIYNETVADLLAGREKGGRNGKSDNYHIYYDPAVNESRVEGLTIVDVADAGSANALIAKAMKNRSTAATKANSQSSRSHSVFRMYIEGTNPGSGQTLKGILNLVDLAGSERIKVSGAEGDRLKETKAINKSLLQLSTVIQSLANNDQHVGFRNSKLTMLLRDSLGGDCKTLMFVNVAPNPESFNESLCSLRFAEKVNACEIGIAKRSLKINLLQDT
jgi:kinesin family member C1